MKILYSYTYYYCINSYSMPLCQKGNLLLTILLATSFSILIKFLLWDSNYLFLLLYVNFFLYLISLVTYFTRPTM